MNKLIKTRLPSKSPLKKATTGGRIYVADPDWPQFIASALASAGWRPAVRDDGDAWPCGSPPLIGSLSSKTIKEKGKT